MKKIILMCLVFVFSFGIFTLKADAAVKVSGYYRSNGTYVPSYHRSNPDSYKSNNYSSYGNYNPYTGKRGYSKY